MGLRLLLQPDGAHLNQTYRWQKYTKWFLFLFTFSLPVLLMSPRQMGRTSPVLHGGNAHRQAGTLEPTSYLSHPHSRPSCASVGCRRRNPRGTVSSIRPAACEVTRRTAENLPGTSNAEPEPLCRQPPRSPGSASNLSMRQLVNSQTVSLIIFFAPWFIYNPHCTIYLDSLTGRWFNKSRPDRIITEINKTLIHHQ